MLLKDVAAQLGIPPATLSSWLKAGVLVPEGYTRRQGRAIAWTEDLLRATATVRDLRSLGLSLEECARLIAVGGRSSGPKVGGDDAKELGQTILAEVQAGRARVVRLRRGMFFVIAESAGDLEGQASLPLETEAANA